MSEELIAQLARLKTPDHPDTSRLLGMIVALAGELFVLKAKVQAQEEALLAAGVVSAEALATIAGGDALTRWLADEEKAFARALLRPFIEPDIALDSTRHMHER